MQKKLFLFLQFAFLGFAVSSSNSFAQSADTAKVTEIAPGVEHYFIHWRSFPLTINVVEVNLKERGVSLRVVKAMRNGVETLDAREKTSQMMEEADNDSTRAVAAINGGFFDVENGRPMDMQIENGTIAKLPEVFPLRSSFLFTSDKKVVIGRFSLNIRLGLSDTVFHINDLNEVCRRDQTILFDRFYGHRTGTNLYGVGVILRPLSEPKVGDALKCVVDTLIKLSGNYKIPKSGFVLVARGDAGVGIGKIVSTRDTVRLIAEFSPKIHGITQALAGWPGIVHDGKNVAAAEAHTEEAIAQLTEERHPRTAIGISKDGTKVLLVVVDGRTKASAGMTLSELANLMIKLGAYNAINMDGGGSSTMAIKGKVVNSPSDATGERAVSNALVVIVSK